jgi:hypothetical protein
MNIDSKFHRISFDLNPDLDMQNSIFISIGYNCSASIFLRNCRIKGKTYPYDWAAHVNVDEIIDAINNKDTFNINKWYRLHDKPRYLPHDIENDSHGDLENNFLNMDCLEKYRRRFERLFVDIYKNNVILFHHYSNENQKLSLEQKKNFLNINKLISFIEIYKFEELVGPNYDQYIMYQNYVLSLFKPNMITSFIHDCMDKIDNNEIKYPYNYSLYYVDLKKIIEKYDLENNLFPEINTNIFFNERNDIIKFLGNCLREKYDTEVCQ